MSIKMAHSFTIYYYDVPVTTWVSWHPFLGPWVHLLGLALTLAAVLALTSEDSRIVLCINLL